MMTHEQLAAFEASLEWKPWAAQGWTLHQTVDGGVMAVNSKLGRATACVPRLTTLVRRLERDAFNYREFLAFKKRHTP